MDIDVFIHGHGDFDPSRDGFTQVPGGCKVSFYTHFAKNMTGETVYDLLRGDGESVPERTIKAYSMVPNLMCRTVESGEMHDAIDAMQKGNRKHTGTNAVQTDSRKLFICPKDISLEKAMKSVLRSLIGKKPRDSKMPANGAKRMAVDITAANVTPAQQRGFTNTPGGTTKTAAEKLEDARNADDCVHFHWVCCQNVRLNPSGGGEHGVNAADLALSLENPDAYKFHWEEWTDDMRRKVKKEKVWEKNADPSDPDKHPH